MSIKHSDISVLVKYASVLIKVKESDKSRVIELFEIAKKENLGNIKFFTNCILVIFLINALNYADGIDGNAIILFACVS